MIVSVGGIVECVYGSGRPLLGNASAFPPSAAEQDGTTRHIYRSVLAIDTGFRD